jgi:hypothetical protein
MKALQAVRDWLAYVRDDVAEAMMLEGMDQALMHGRKIGMAEALARVALIKLHDAAAPLICRVCGHKFKDYSTDRMARSGGFYYCCTRCGYHVHGHF